MTFRKLLFCASVLFIAFSSLVRGKEYSVTSPDGRINAVVAVGDNVKYSVSYDGSSIIEPSSISMALSDGIIFGKNDKVRKVLRTTVDEVLSTMVYKKAEVRDNYNQMTLVFKEFKLVFRAYDDGVAYHFESKLDPRREYQVVSEQAEFCFCEGSRAYIPYVNSPAQDIEGQFFNSFENTYSVHKGSEWRDGRLSLLPVAVDVENKAKVVITEANLVNYPGMYLLGKPGSSSVGGVFAPYPKTVVQGGHNMLQGVVKEREDFIAKASGNEIFPWRVIMVSTNDADFAVNDMVWKLSPSQDKDTDFSWVRPGKVAWDWWNDWNIYDVDFKSGINNETYRYYIDFASEHGIEYVILDEGWAVNLEADLMKVVPEINLPELVAYGKERGVGLILWAGHWAFDRDMENVCRHYSAMGIKGFKIDFMDRDDQVAVNFHARAAQMAAKYGLMVDFHGTYKPTGLSRRFPNVVNYEGVHGLEQMKWKPENVDQVTYDVTIPFIRMAAGPMDYTQGAMRNASRGNYRPVYDEPMSQGTRCRQLAEYVVFESPLNMLCDSPSNYMNEPECTEFISECPVVWDDSRAVNGELGKYITLARRSGDDWYVGALTDWEAREMTLDLSFLGDGDWFMEIFRDGVNAAKAARDYEHVTEVVPFSRRIDVSLAPGGGWVAKITRKPRLIFDTDMGNDVDDALALAMLYRYADEGKSDLLGIVVNKNEPMAVEYIDVVNTYYGHSSTPIGRGERLADSSADNRRTDGRNYVETVMQDFSFSRSITDYDSIPSAVALYRRLLSGQPDGSVTIVSTGFFTNLAALLDSGADEFSPLSGRELIARKVRQVSAMAGNVSWEDGRDIFTEYNVHRDIASAKKFFAECPVPIVVSPFELGVEICYPAAEIEANLGFDSPNPVVEAYKAYMPMPYDRPTWDLTSVVYAVEGYKYFTGHTRGTITIDEAGLSHFVPSLDGNHIVLRVAPESRHVFLRHLIDLTVSQTSKKK